jgi:hypothetical protein
MSAPQKISVILNSPGDWDEWIEVIKTQALAGKVWQYLDPSEDVVPALNEPVAPTPTQINTQKTTVGQLTAEEREEYKILRQDYKWERDQYDKKDAALSSLRTAIQSSVSRSCLHYTFETSNAREMLTELKKRLQPTDQLRELSLSAKYQKLKKTPKTHDLDNWLKDWEKTYYQCKKIDLPEVQGARPVRDFLRAVSTTAPEFATYWSNDILKSQRAEQRAGQQAGQQAEQQAGQQAGQQAMQITPDLYEIVEHFRDHRRHLAATEKAQSAAFATDVPPQGQNQDGKRKRPCVCGKDERFTNCAYLFEENRPAGWKPDPEIQKRVDDKLKKPNLKAIIDKIRAGKEKAKKETQQQSSSEVDSLEDGTFAVSSFTASSDKVYALHDSFILDSASTIHICNDPGRFQSLRQAEENDCLIAGASQVPIRGYGLVEITLQLPTTARKIRLANVAFVPSFHTNIVSLDRLMQKNVHWDTRQQELRLGDEIFGKVEKKHGQWVLEYNELPAAAFVARSAQPRPDSIATADVWHRRLGHAGPEALAHLSTAVTGAKLKGPLTIDCEACSLSKAHKQISRRPAPRAEKPFEKVHFDLIQMTEGFNGDRWILHFLDDRTRMNFVYTLPDRTQSSVLTTIRQFVALVERQFDYKIKTFKTDNESALGKESTTWIKNDGYTLDQSAPYTPDQNGPAERSGKSFIIDARSIRIDAKLPAYLWPEIVKAAAYMLNRKPTRTLDWKTPIEVLQTCQDDPNPNPSTGHLKMYGCRTYPLIHNVPKTQKLDPRAEIGYLVGYDSTNIFRIWVPERHQVIRTRDVTFDEWRKYHPDDLRVALADRIEDPIQFIEFLDVEDLAGGVSDAWETQSIESTIEVIPRDAPSDVSSDGAQKQSSTDPVQSQHGLPTPETTPAPTDPIPQGLSQSGQALEDMPTASIAPDRHQPQQEIFGDPEDPRNIVEGSRTRRPKQRNEAYAADLAHPEQLPAYHSAFALGVKDGKPKIHEKDLPPPPRSWKELQRHRYGKEFQQAAEKEYQAVNNRGVFKIVRKTSDIRLIPLMWVFTYKLDTDGYLVKFKARICVRGDLQPRNDRDTYAATLAARIFRVLMAITAAYDLEAFQLDAVNAFTNSFLDETVYCAFPDGFEQDGDCLLLLRALYGLRRSPLLWLKELSTTLRDLDLHEISGQPCLFTTDDGIIVFFYVDDIVLLCRPKDLPKLDKLRTALMQRYEMRDLGKLSWFLGIRIIRDRLQRRLWLCQDAYIKKIANTFHLTDRKPPTTPLAVEELIPNDNQATPQEIYLYQRKVGSLLYATTITRPDAARAVNKLSEFLMNPSARHQEAVDRAILYLYGTSNLAIEYSASSDQPITCASDAAFADNPATRYSTEGYLFKMFNGPIDWRSTKQKTVTTSSTEAELLALSHASKEAIWWKRLLNGIKQLDIDVDFAILCDNRQTIRLLTAETPQVNTKLKHIDIHGHWLRQEIANGNLQIQWVPTTEMPADGLTKALPRQRFEIFINQLGLIDISTRLNDDLNDDIKE